MKILHIWDQAAVACTLAKYQRKLGHESIVIKRNGYDPYGIMSFYNEKTLNVKFSKIFTWLVVKKAKNYDIIHIHDLFEIVAVIREKYPKKKIVLHYHGSILRLTPRNILQKYESKVDCILVSTPDLLNFVEGTYLPNPIDIEHFHPRKVKKNQRALSVMSKWESQEVLDNLLKSRNISLNIFYQNRNLKPIKYSEMPDYLSDFEYFIDLKLVYNSKPMPAFGCLGLQSLSLGLKVLNYKFQIEDKFPTDHCPEKVTSNLLQIYSEL